MKVTQSANPNRFSSYRERLSSEIGEVFRAFERKLIFVVAILSNGNGSH